MEPPRTRNATYYNYCTRPTPQVWNRNPTDVRVVLLVRFWHPDIPPADYAAAKRQMRSAVLRHRRNTVLPPLDAPLVPP